MCIALWKLDTYTGTPDQPSLILVFNRDEYFDRETRGFHIWENNPSIFAPKDMKPINEEQRGSWIGTNKQGRIAFLTNYREHVPHHDGMISRGALVRDYLLNDPVTPGGQMIQLNSGESVAEAYARCLFEERDKYDGFNLVLFDFKPPTPVMMYLTNRGSVCKDDGKPGFLSRLKSDDILGISNSTICNSWVKVENGKDHFSNILKESSNLDDDKLATKLIEMMTDQSPFSSDNLPKKIADLASCIFIPKLPGLNGGSGLNGTYGTRATNALILRGRNLTVAEIDYTVPSDMREIKISHFAFDDLEPK